MRDPFSYNYIGCFHIKLTLIYNIAPQKSEFKRLDINTQTGE